MSTLQRRRMMMAQGVTYGGIPLMITNVGGESIEIALNFNASHRETPPTIYYNTTGKKSYKKWDLSNITLSKGSTLYLFGKNSVIDSTFVVSGSSAIHLDGKLEALLQGQVGINQFGSYALEGLFKNVTQLESVGDIMPQIIAGVNAPSTWNSANRYLSLFENTSITEIPDNFLKETSLSSPSYIGLYRRMFFGCTKLTTIPRDLFINQTGSVAQYAYREMFQNCTNLEAAADIYCTSQEFQTTFSMYRGCKKITDVKVFTKTLNSNHCMQYFVADCDNLQSIEFDINRIVNWGGLQYAMSNCKNLTKVSIKVNKWEPEKNPTYGYSDYWMRGVSPTGTFICPKELAEATDGYYDEEGNFVAGAGRGDSTVPPGWYIDFPIIDARDGDANAMALMAVISQQTHADGTPWAANSLVMMKSEAEKVTDIGTIFKENDSIIDFTALQYFKLSELKEKAFHKCYRLTKVKLPNTITSLRRECLSYTKIDSLIIPDSVVTIGENITNGSFNIKSIFIGKGVISMAYEAFIYLRKCESIEVHPDNQNFDSRENCNAIIQKSNNQLLCGCANTIIPNSVTSIGGWAFRTNNVIAKLTIPKSVVESNGYAFDGTSALKTIYYEGSFVDWFKINFTFSYANPLRGKTGVSLIINGVNVISETMIIPEGVTSVGTNVFPTIPDIKHIVIPSSVTSWNTESFYDNSLESIVVDSGNTKYDSRDVCNAIIETASNKLIYACKNTIIPNSVTVIGHSAFRYTSVSQTIEIPASVTTIENWSFNNSNIKTIKINAETPPVLASTNVFASATIIYVPDNSVETYKAANLWSTFADRIKSINELPQ